MTELVDVAALLVAVAVHAAMGAPILNNPMRPRLWTAQRRESTD